MRTLILLVALSTLVASQAIAGRLDIAIIQFTDGRDIDSVAEALKKTDLAQLADADKTQSNVRILQGGWVLFAQSIGVAPDSKFANSTRIGNSRADVSGSFSKGSIALTVQLTTGIKAGLRKFSEATYSGSGSIAGGSSQILSLSKSKGQSLSLIKGLPAQTVDYNCTNLLVARYTP
ncbi:MAG TPA: hypothetical protein VIM48_09200 [Chthoniobacterales bacterium]